MLNETPRQIVSLILKGLAFFVAVGILTPNYAVGQSARMLPQSQLQMQLSFAPLVKRVTPAVVNIYAKKIVATRVSPFANDPFFQDFFRDFSRVEPRIQNSLGSGVILSSEGMVVTNYHVVGQAKEIRVVLSDRREYAAQIVLSDEESDLAILEIEGGASLPYLDILQGSDVEVGDLVLAVGNPFGVGQTVSSGIVSGLARSGTATGNARGYFLQTDAPINPGNSGGALVNIRGELIGVNTSIMTRSGGSNGIGFAIPAALVHEFLRQAKNGEREFKRPWAGLTVQPVDADMARSVGIDPPQGVIIADLHPQSPFKLAGLRIGDVVLSVAGEPVNTGPQMLYLMTIEQEKGQVALSVQRQGGGAEDVMLVILDKPTAQAATPQGDETIYSLRASEILEGLQIQNLNPSLRYELRVPDSVDGVLVVAPGRRGGRIGLRAADVIAEVNGQSVGDISALGPVLARGQGRINLLIYRSGRLVSIRAFF